MTSRRQRPSEVTRSALNMTASSTYPSASHRAEREEPLHPKLTAT